jgi:hypothetical protein
LNYRNVLLVGLASAGLAVASCSHPSGTGTTGSGGSNGTGGSGDCPVGSVGCPCIGTTCDQGLSCADLGGGNMQCVTTAGTGGTPGAGGSVATGGTPGTGGTGGTQATGGSPGTGGNGTGTGGSPATGGSPGTGGNPGTGGGSSGTNLVVNGDFSQGTTNWHFENGTAAVNNGQYCASSTSSGALFGWQNMTTPLMLSGTQSYTLSYQASGSNNAALHIKVAHADSPYTPDDYDPMSNNQTTNDQLMGSLQTFTHTFTPAMGDDTDTGIAFFVESGQSICIANVSLTQN